MKRDLELVRRILLHLEGGSESASPSGWGEFVENGYEMSAIHYHVRLLNDAGLIEADEIVPGQWWPERMTWSGHEFAEAARNEEVWAEVKNRIESRVGGAPFLLFHELLIRSMRERLENDNEATRSSRPTKAPGSRRGRARDGRRSRRPR